MVIVDPSNPGAEGVKVPIAHVESELWKLVRMREMAMVPGVIPFEMRVTVLGSRKGATLARALYPR